MSTVALTIAGRRYNVSCDPGEEEHIAHLGRLIDKKLATVPSLTGQNEVRTLLYAALLLADELHENSNKGSPLPPETLETLAEDFEALAERLEGGAANP